jgi:hypothetical protein
MPTWKDVWVRRSQSRRKLSQTEPVLQTVHDPGGNRQLRVRPIFHKKVKAHDLILKTMSKVKMSALSEGLVLLILLHGLFVAKATNTSKPNIIILLADDIGK